MEGIQSNEVRSKSPLIHTQLSSPLSHAPSQSSAVPFPTASANRPHRCRLGTTSTIKRPPFLNFPHTKPPSPPVRRRTHQGRAEANSFKPHGWMEGAINEEKMQVAIDIASQVMGSPRLGTEAALRRTRFWLGGWGSGSCRFGGVTRGIEFRVRWVPCWVMDLCSVVGFALLACPRGRRSRQGWEGVHVLPDVVGQRMLGLFKSSFPLHHTLARKQRRQRPIASAQLLLGSIFIFMHQILLQSHSTSSLT